MKDFECLEFLLSKSVEKLKIGSLLPKLQPYNRKSFENTVFILVGQDFRGVWEISQMYSSFTLQQRRKKYYHFIGIGRTVLLLK